MNPLHAAYYADDAVHHTAQVVENVRIARDTFRLRFTCPEMARRIIPGQFLMLRIAGCDDPLLARPLALYNTIVNDSGDTADIDVVYLVKGKFTQRLVTLVPGQHVEVWGPLGNGFAAEPVEHLIMVAGGIGQTPFLALAQEYLGERRYGAPPRKAPRASRVTLCYGARSAELLAGVRDFEQSGVEVHLATDDGTQGHHGLVTDLLRRLLEQSDGQRRVVCCGPEMMMAAVAKLCRECSQECQVSLETPMACGIGICFTCVARVKDQSGQWDYKRTCVEGPVFDAELIDW